MKKVITLILILLFSLPFGKRWGESYAQNKTIDSLQQVLKKAKEDNHKVNILNALNREYININSYDTALYYIGMALPLAEKLNFKTGIATAYKNTGLAYIGQGNYPEALEKTSAALKIYEVIGDKIGIAACYNNIGIVYQGQGNYPAALKNYFAALKINEAAGNKKWMAFNYDNIEGVYDHQGNYPEALKTSFAALKIYETIGDKGEIADCYVSAGNIYIHQDNYQAALKNYTAAFKIYETIGDKGGIANYYGNTGSIYERQGNYPDALKSYLSALKIYEATGDKEGIATCYNNIGVVYYYQGNYPEALNNYLYAVKICEAIQDKQSLSRCYPNIGLVYVKLHHAAEGKAWIKKGLALSEKTGAKESIRDAYLYLSSADSALGNYEEALESYKQYTVYKDSLKNEENTKKLTQTAMQYEFDKKEATAKAVQDKKDTLVQQEMKRQKLVRNGFIGGFALLMLFTVVVIRQRNKTKKEKQRAEQSEKFKQQFLANMSHEIRTPMNAIIGMANLTLNTPLNAKQQGYLTGIHKASENLLHIINEILDLSKIEAGKIELEQIDFSLRDMVEQVRQTLLHKAEEKNIELIATVAADVPDVLIGDPVRLNQVLMNLAGNAIKFTDKGSVQITVSKVQEQIRFSITDTGIGIPQDKLKSIFENFTQAHSSDTRKYGGTGLGLSISKQLAELMGSNISIESEVGSGTTFSFAVNLPLGSKENLQQRHLSEQIDGSTLDGLKILLADDNADNRIVCRDTLEAKSKVIIIEAANGKEVLERLTQRDFDIILMDVQMPVMDGYEAMQQIRNSFAAPKKDIPVIALTASVIRSDLDKCRAAGMNDYVPKPFKPAQLFTAIAALTAREIKFMESKKVDEQTQQYTVSKSFDLAYLEKFCESDKAKMQKYIHIFLDSIPALTASLNTAITEHNTEEIAAQVHGFKTKLVMMGMRDAKDLAVQTEAYCRTENPDPSLVNEQTTELINIIINTAEALRKEKLLYIHNQ